MAVRRILTTRAAPLRAAPLAILCVAAAAAASPRTDPTTGRAVFTGATMPHATSISLNPAAIGLGLFDEVYVAFAGALDQFHIDLEKVDLSGTHTPGPRVRDVEPSPAGVLAFIYHLAGEAVTLGFEARTTPRESFPEKRDALRYHTLGGGQRDWLASVGASIKVTGDLFFGASLSHQNSFLRLRYARDTALDAGTGPRGVASDCGGAPCGLENRLATEIYDVDVHSPAFATANLKVSVGALYQIARDTWIGVGYHTPPGLSVQTELAGRVQVERAPRDCPGVCDPIKGDAVVEIQFPASVDAELRARLPSQLDLHIGGRWEDLSRFSAYDVRLYGSTLPRNGIPEWMLRPRGMHDAFAVWAGVEQVDTGKKPRTYGVRAGYETASVPEARTSPVTIAPASFTLDVGAQWRTQSHLIFQLSYGAQFFPSVNARDSAFDPIARIACLNSETDYSTPACRSVRDGYAIPSAAGDYERIQHALRFGLRYEFQ